MPPIYGVRVQGFKSCPATKPSTALNRARSIRDPVAAGRFAKRSSQQRTDGVKVEHGPPAREAISWMMVNRGQLDLIVTNALTNRVWVLRPFEQSDPAYLGES